MNITPYAPCMRDAHTIWQTHFKLFLAAPSLHPSAPSTLFWIFLRVWILMVLTGGSFTAALALLLL
jgi:hypothetical protein